MTGVQTCALPICLAGVLVIVSYNMSGWRTFKALLKNPKSDVPVKLAEEIQKRADHTINCFLQVNVSGEESKHGFSAEELDTVLKQIENLDKICIVGLMTMAPIDADAQELDKIFAETNELRKSIQEKKLKNVPCDQLSMGMSRDYDMAIQNGSTFVRIGSAFFKENGE